MTKTIVSAVLLAFLHAASAQAQGTATITGRVTDALTGQPLSGIDVRVVATDDSTGDSMTTAATGEYTLEVVAGTYHLYMENGLNYVNQTYGGRRCTGTCQDRGQPLPLVAGEHAVVDFALDLGGTISVRVVDATTGAGVLASVTLYDGKRQFVLNTLNERFDNLLIDGRRVGGGLPTGPYFLGVLNPPGHASELYNNVACAPMCRVADATPIRVVSRQTTDGIVIALQPAGVIAGRVTDAVTGQHLPGVEITAARIEGGSESRFYGMGQSDSTGFYRIRGLQPGAYNLYTDQVPGYVRTVFPQSPLGCQFPEFPDCNREIRAGAPVSVGAGQVVNRIDFRLRRAGSIAGHLTVAGTGALNEGLVEAFTASGAFAGFAWSVSDGSYVLEGLLPGRYFVRARVSLMGTFWGRVYDGFPCAAFDCSALAGTPVTVTEGSATTGIDFSLPAFNASISGTVRSTATGELLDAIIELYSGDTAIATRSGSSYTFSGVAAGTYRIRVSAQGHIAEWFGNACDPCGAHGTAVIVASGESRTGIDFSLEAASRITGVVTKPSPEATMIVEALRADGTVVRYGFPGSDNKYTIDGLPAGTYFVRAFFRHSVDPVYPGELYDDVGCDGRDCPLTGATPVTVVAGATTSGIDFTLDRPAEIHGQVYAEGETEFDSDLPAVVARVQAFTADGREAGNIAYGGYEGRYTLRVRGGTYYLKTVEAGVYGYADQVYKDLICPACSPTSGTPVTVAAGAIRTGIDFMLLPGGTVKGTVHDSAGAAPLDNVTVTAYTAGGLKVASAGSDHLGNFTIDGLGAGSYFLATSNTQGYADEVYDDVACGTCDPSRGQAVHVSGGQTTSGIAFALTRGALLSGRVVDTTGNPRGGVPVSIFDVAGTLVARAVSARDGQYLANARAGTSYAKAGGVDGLATALYDGQPCPDGGCDPVSGTPIVGAAGETVRGIDFSLAVCSPLSLSPVALSPGNVGASYTATLSIAGGTGASRFVVSAGTLPPGMTLDPDGTLSGTPTAGGRFTFTVTGTDSVGCGVARVYTLDVAACARPLSSTPLVFDVRGSATTIQVTPNPACQADIRFNVPWLGPGRDLRPSALEFNVAAHPGGRRTGTISVGATVITVNQGIAASTAPFGFFDGPAPGSTVAGSIAVSGWALDDLRVVNVSIMRAPIAGEGPGLIFLGNAVFVPGARPDVETLYQELPYAGRAGFGYLLLTNMLPNRGNGTFTLFAVAHDTEGHSTTVGQTTIHVNNSASTAPFGAIDTPGQGETISGSSYVNFGWALTPQPKTIPRDGSTISVLIDGAGVGPVSYDHFRPDVAGLFPGLNNSDGAVGHRTFDTTTLADGLHTIAWVVTDDAGASQGIGSRYFTVNNSGAAASLTAEAEASPPALRAAQTGARIEITQLERVQVDLTELMPDAARCTGTFTGFERVLSEHRPLPIGSTLDSATGVFTWIPGPAFSGTYLLLFSRDGCADGAQQLSLEITVRR